MVALRMIGGKQLFSLWIAALIVLFSVVETVAQPASAETDVQPKRILLLFSYGQSFQPWVTWSREIRRELNRQSPWPLNFQEHSLVSALSGDLEAERKFVDFLTALYAHEPPDLIVALGAPAAGFVQQYRAG